MQVETKNIEHTQLPVNANYYSGLICYIFFYILKFFLSIKSLSKYWREHKLLQFLLFCGEVLFLQFIDTSNNSWGTSVLNSNSAEYDNFEGVNSSTKNCNHSFIIS